MIRGTTANSNDVNSSKVLRQQAGTWLKSLREKRGLSQRQLASFVKVDYYTFISQIESGKGRVPPDRLMEWADGGRSPTPTCQTSQRDAHTIHQLSHALSPSFQTWQLDDPARVERAYSAMLG